VVVVIVIVIVIAQLNAEIAAKASELGQKSGSV
jgi:hypothetical protein